MLSTWSSSVPDSPSWGQRHWEWGPSRRVHQLIPKNQRSPLPARTAGRSAGWLQASSAAAGTTPALSSSPGDEHTCVLGELAAGQPSGDLLGVPGLCPHGAASADHTGLRGDCWQSCPCLPQTVLSAVQRQPRPIRNSEKLQARHRTSPLLPQCREAASSPCASKQAQRSPPKAAPQAPGPAEPALASGHPAGISCQNLPGWVKAEIWDKSAALACS